MQGTQEHRQHDHFLIMGSRESSLVMAACSPPYKCHRSGCLGIGQWQALPKKRPVRREDGPQVSSTLLAKHPSRGAHQSWPGGPEGSLAAPVTTLEE